MAVKKISRQKFFSDDSILNESTTKTSASLNKKTTASNRLGKKVIKFSVSDKTADIASSLINTPKISVVTFLGEREKNKSQKEFSSKRQGNSKKNIFHLRNSLLPLITVNREEITHLNGELNFDYSNSTFGQKNDRVFVEDNKLVPFNDRLSRKFSPQEFVESNGKIIAYPNLTNGIENFANYLNPDSIDGDLGGPARNGTIDVFGTVAGLLNTNPSDIHVFGIRCNIGIIDQEILQYDKERGSSVVDSKYELKQSEYVFFEDSQDLRLDSKVVINNKVNFRSDEGIISNSSYKCAPFDDKIINEDKYVFMDNNRQRLLLSSSNTSMSEIGTRYKSMGNGFTNNPFYTSTIHNNLGTDSIVFRGLMRG